MKGFVCLRHVIWAGFLICGLIASTRADLFIFWPGYIFRYDEHSGALISKHSRDFRTETVDSIAVAPNGDFFAFGNSMGWGGVFQLDGITGQYKQTVISDNNSGIFIPYRLDFGPDSDLFISSYSGGIGRYDPATGEFKGTFLSREEISDRNGLMTFGPDGNLYLATTNAIVRYNGWTGEYIGEFASFDTNANVSTFCFSLDGDFYLLSQDARVYRHDPNSRQLTQFINAVAAGMHRPRKMVIGPDGDVYIGDDDSYGAKTPLDVWRFDGKTGSSKGIFIKGDVPLYGDGWITAMVFSGPRLQIRHGNAGPCLKWPNTHGNFELQSCDGLNMPWQTVQEAPTNVGCSLTLDLSTSSNNCLFRLIKR